MDLTDEWDKNIPREDLASVHSRLGMKPKPSAESNPLLVAAMKKEVSMCTILQHASPRTLQANLGPPKWKCR